MPHPGTRFGETYLIPSRASRRYRWGMASETLHEPPETLSNGTKDMHRAISSLMEELEAVDWYAQRAEACTDDDLRAILVHNKNEEIEHAIMTLEWLRRRDPVFAGNVSTYVGTSGPITEIESAEKSSASTASTVTLGAGKKSSSDGSLGIGSLKGT